MLHNMIKLEALLMGILNSVTVGGSGNATIKTANVATSTSSGKVTFSVENNPTWWGMCAHSMSTSRPASGILFFAEGSSDAPCGYKNVGCFLQSSTNRPSKSYNASTHKVTFTQYSTKYRIPADTEYMLFYI